MGFKKLIDSKKTQSLFAVLVLSGTNMLMAQSTGGTALDGSTTDKGVMWGSVAYYIMLFLVLCLGIAVFGKILKIYDLTQKMQGKKGLNWNNIMGICCLIFLVAGMYGAYWSLTVQGSMKLPV